jgi:transcriptional regulator with XRE-family HTH domain
MKEGERIVRIISAIDLYVIDEIRKKREDLKKSQAAMSVDMEFSDKLIGSIENPSLSTKYSLRHINLVAKALECNISDFFPPIGHLKDDLLRITVEKKKTTDNGKEKIIPVIIKREPLTKEEIQEYNKSKTKSKKNEELD